MIVGGVLGWNGFWEEMAPSRQRDLVKKNASGAVRLIKTQTYPLADLLRAAQPTADVLHVSLLSIDTEGSELSVLRSLDWGRFRVDVVQVEKSQHEKAIDRLMRKHGFVVRTRTRRFRTASTSGAPLYLLNVPGGRFAACHTAEYMLRLHLGFTARLYSRYVGLVCVPCGHPSGALMNVRLCLIVVPSTYPGAGWGETKRETRQHGA